MNNDITQEIEKAFDSYKELYFKYFQANNHDEQRILKALVENSRKTLMFAANQYHKSLENKHNEDYEYE